MILTGLTVDVPAVDPAVTETFYTAVLGRGPDLRPPGVTAEWRIIPGQPEVTLRIAAAPDDRVGGQRIGLGVADLEAERDRLRAVFPSVPDIVSRPGVIALLELTDPDGNRVVLWQDLLIRRPSTGTM